MSPMAAYPICCACGDRIGVYEPVWRQLVDGGFAVSALLQIDWHRTRPRLFHLGCLEVDG